MHVEEKERLIISLQDHVNNITNLRYGSYNLAEILSQRTKRLATKYSPEFLDEIDKINFTENSETYGLNVWNDSYRKLLTISQAMLDGVQQSGEHSLIIAPSDTKNKFTGKTNNRPHAALLFVIIASLLLWSFNALIKWRWLTEHPRKIAIYLSFQTAIIVIFLLFFTKKKQVRFIELLGIAVAIAFAVISLLN